MMLNLDCEWEQSQMMLVNTVNLDCVGPVWLYLKELRNYSSECGNREWALKMRIIEADL